MIKRKTRRLMLCLAVVCFLIVAPAIVLYSLGYSLDLTKKKIVLTGGLDLKSKPAKAEIYLNNKLKTKTPRFVKRLIPKEYELEVKKEGYHSWHKKIFIEPQLATKYTDIVLLLQNPEITIEESNLASDFSIDKWLKKNNNETVKNFLMANQNIATAGFKIIDNKVYYIQTPSYILYQSNLDGTDQKQISSSALEIAETYQIFALTDNQVAVINSQKKLYLFNPKSKAFDFLADNIVAAQFSSDFQKLLYFSQNEIWVYYLEDILTQPTKKKGDKELITRLNQPIKEAVWYFESNKHIIFSVGNQIKFIEIDGRDFRNCFDFIASDAKQMIYDQKTERLYFITADNLNSVRLFETGFIF